MPFGFSYMLYYIYIYNHLGTLACCLIVSKSIRLTFMLNYFVLVTVMEAAECIGALPSRMKL